MLPRFLIPGVFLLVVAILLVIGVVSTTPTLIMAGCCLNPLAFFLLGRATVGFIGNRRLRFE